MTPASLELLLKQQLWALHLVLGFPASSRNAFEVTAYKVIKSICVFPNKKRSELDHTGQAHSCPLSRTGWHLALPLERFAFGFLQGELDSTRDRTAFMIPHSCSLTCDTRPGLFVVLLEVFWEPATAYTK